MPDVALQTEIVCKKKKTSYICYILCLYRKSKSAHTTTIEMLNVHENQMRSVIPSMEIVEVAIRGRYHKLNAHFQNEEKKKGNPKTHFKRRTDSNNLPFHHVVYFF